MEHVERQDERENELTSEVDELEQQGDELEDRGQRVDRQIDEVRDEVERKKGSADAPGLQAEEQPTGEPPGDAAGGAPRTEDDE